MNKLAWILIALNLYWSVVLSTNFARISRGVDRLQVQGNRLEAYNQQWLFVNPWVNEQIAKEWATFDKLSNEEKLKVILESTNK